jgi:hypothetical protein
VSDDGGFIPNYSDINWNAMGPNTHYVAPNLNVQSIPNQNANTFSNPNGAAPNFNGNVTVDTASLAAFGQWVADELTQPLQQLKPALQSVAVEPGSFYWADYIRSYVNGTGATSGLKNQFITVVEDILDGLTGISKGVDELVQLYATTEDLNSAQAANLESDLSNAFGNALSAFNHVGDDSQAGGSSSNSSGS